MAHLNPPATPPQEKSFDLDVEVLDTIAELIAFGEHKNLYECCCQTSEGNRVSVSQVFTETERRTRTSYHVRVWANYEQAPDDDIVILDTIIQEYDLETLFRLKREQEAITRKRAAIEVEDSALAKEECDLESHIMACTLALCCGVED